MKKIVFLALFLLIAGFISCGKADSGADTDADSYSDFETDADPDTDVDENMYYDSETGFLWSKRSESINVNAEEYCSTLSQGGYDDWEVPTIEQLQTLLINVPEEDSIECRYAIDGRYSKLGDRGFLCSSSYKWSHCGPPKQLVFRSPTDEKYFAMFDFNDLNIKYYNYREHGYCYTRCVKTNIEYPALALPIQKEEKNVEETKDLITGGIYKWSNYSPDSMRFKDAATYCENLEESGYKDWRLPNISELRTVIKNCPDSEIDGECSLTDYFYYEYCRGCAYSADGTYSKSGEGGGFWTSTLNTSVVGNPAIIIDFDKAYFTRAYEEEECALVRCVRNDVGDIREGQPCRNLPGSGKWNSVDKITQTWDGTSWTPSEMGVFNETPSDKECRFKCKEGFVGYDNSCIEPELVGKWSKRAVDKMNWEDAVNYCENLEENGKSDWRLPLISELRSLIQNCPGNETGGECGLTDHFDKIDDTKSCVRCGLVNENEYSKLWERGIFWSSKTYSGSDDFAWSVHFYLGSLSRYNKENLLSVRCTRSDIGEVKGGQKCEGLPENAFWNTVDEISQTWNGSKWEPSTAGSYDSEPTTTECKYRCDDEYTLYNNVCAENDLLEKWSELSENAMNYSDAVSYCENLDEKGSSYWFLPSISELRTLIKNCYNTETGGPCGLTDDCLKGGASFGCRYSECGHCYEWGWWCSSETCDCYCGDESKTLGESCPNRDDGRYSKLGDIESLWTTSKMTAIDNWLVKFGDATMFSDSRSSQHFVRCIRRD